MQAEAGEAVSEDKGMYSMHALKHKTPTASKQMVSCSTINANKLYYLVAFIKRKERHLEWKRQTSAGGRREAHCIACFAVPGILLLGWHGGE